MAVAAAYGYGRDWCAASAPASLLLFWAYTHLRQSPYGRILRTSTYGAPLAVLMTGWVPGWPGVATRWIAFFIVAGWHHSALQALREWARFSTVIGPEGTES